MKKLLIALLLITSFAQGQIKKVTGYNTSTFNLTQLQNRVTALENGGAGSGISMSAARQLIARVSGYELLWFIPDSIIADAAQRGTPFGKRTAHPLWLYYGGSDGVENPTILARAQQDFPTALSLQDDIVSLALQNAVDYINYDTGAVSHDLNIPLGVWPSKEWIIGYGVSFINKNGNVQDYTQIRVKAAKGTIITSTVTDRPCVTVQGNSESVFENLDIEGLNGGIPIGGDYGQGSLYSLNYFSPYGSLVSTSNSTYAPYAGFSIDTRSSAPALGTGQPHYPCTPLNPKYFRYTTFTSQYNGDTSYNRFFKFRDGQWYNYTAYPYRYDRSKDDPLEASNWAVWDTANWYFNRNVSSNIKTDYVSTSRFIVGYGIQLNGSQVGNGDFCSNDHFSSSQNLEGVSSGCNQQRNTSFFNFKIDQNYIGICADTRGSKQGRYDLFINGHLSNYIQFQSSSYDWQGPLTFQNVYLESGKRFGKFGNKGNIYGSTVYINDCVFGFGHYQADYTPAIVAEGSAQLVFQGGNVSGRNLNMDMTPAPVFKKVNFILQPDYSYDNTFHFENNIKTYSRAYYNNPIVNISGSRAVYEDCSLTVRDGSNSPRGAYKLDSRENKGTSYYSGQHIYDDYGADGQLYTLPAGRLGLENDFFIRSTAYLGLGVSSSFDSASGVFTFPLTNLPSGTPDVREAVKKGDYFVAPANKLVFMVDSVGTTNVKCHLMGGFTQNNYHNNRYPDINVADITSAITNWHWWNNQSEETAPTTGTATTSGVTSISYINGRLGHPVNPINQFAVGDLVYIYNYDGNDIRKTVGKWHLNKIASIDTGTNAITFVWSNSDVTGRCAVIKGSSVIK